MYMYIPYRPVATSYRGGGWSTRCLYTEVVQQLRNHTKCGKKNVGNHLLAISKSSQSNFRLCTTPGTTLAPFSASVHNTTLSFLLIPATSRSYMPWLTVTCHACTV